MENHPVSRPIKPGQVFTGRITELFPQNRAIVKIGGQSIHAQLDVPLTKGRPYLFRVMSTSEQVKLKVIDSYSNKKGALNPELLLKNLGVKGSIENVVFVRSLIDDHIPFTATEIRQALSILHRSKDITRAREVLLQMIQKALPIKQSIFDALIVRKTVGVTKAMDQVYRDIENSKAPEKPSISSILTMLKGVSDFNTFKMSAVDKIISEVANQNPSSFHLFKKAGLIHQSETFSQFQQTWKQWINLISGDKTDIQYLTSNASVETPPLPTSVEQMAKQLYQLFEKQVPLSQKEQRTLQQWQVQLERLFLQKGSNDLVATGEMDSIPETLKKRMIANHQSLLQKQSFHKLLPYLSEPGKAAVKELMHVLNDWVDGKGAISRASVQTALTSIVKLLEVQVPKSSQPALIDWAGRVSAAFPSNTASKEEFLIKLKVFLHLSGLQDEVIMKENAASKHSFYKEQSLKTLLIQSLDGIGTIRQETARQGLNLLNGLQMTAHQETNQSIQLSLQFPGNIIGSKRDIHLDMEGRKTKNDEIDPDFCHIIFYLELEHLRETVITLNIANRRVSVTVINDHSNIQEVTNRHEMPLKLGLAKLGYELSAVQIKRPLEQDKKAHEESSPINVKDQGVDVQI